MDMTRRSFLVTATTGVSTAAFGRISAFGRQAPTIKPTFSSIRGNVGTMVGRGGTIGWLITGGGNVVVDSQYPEMASICVQFLAQNSKNQELKVVANTHHHRDHTAGNTVFEGVARQIVGHRNVPGLMKQAASGGDTTQRLVPPGTTFTKDWAIKVGHEEIELMHYGAAHTGGDAIVTFTNANVVHLGDLVFNRRHPYIDRPAGASIRGWIDVLRRTVSDHAPDTEYIFGHAAEGFPIRGRQSDVDHMRRYLLTLLEHVGSAVTAGRTRAEIVAAKTILEGFPQHGPLNEHVLTAAYEELTA
jgi:cyclase